MTTGCNGRVATAQCRPEAAISELRKRLAVTANEITPLGMLDTAFHVPAAKRHRFTSYYEPSTSGRLMTDYTGNIWTGYFDEASICAVRVANASTARTRTPPPLRTTLSTPGLIRWTSAGEPAWYAVFDTNGPHSWFDLYALNVGAHRTWAYPYTGFPIVEIDQHGVRCVRRNPVRSANGVIIADNDIAFIASHGPHPRTPGHYTVTFAQINDGPVEATTTAPLLLPDGTRPNAWARHHLPR